MAKHMHDTAVPSPFKFDPKKLIDKLGKDHMIEVLKQMVLIRNFETRCEAAYQHGLVGGFLHVYSGQEAIATAAVDVIKDKGWWSVTYRCHAHALLLGATPEEVMAELYGKAAGNAGGRGGSMHLYTDRMLGGFGIVGAHTPIAAGAAFSAKYRGSDEVALCFLGDGAVVQGAFHETLNLCALWDLPCLFVIENNQWGMGTAVERAVSVERIAESKAPGYGMKGYTCDGMDYLECYNAFHVIYEQMKKDSRPVMLEIVTERFRGHSVSDPAIYRTKEELQACMQRDPILVLRSYFEEKGWLDYDGYKKLDKEARDRVIAAMKYADEAPAPSPAELEEGVFAP